MPITPGKTMARRKRSEHYVNNKEFLAALIKYREDKEIAEIKARNGIAGYKVEPWLKTSTEDLFVVNLSDILTMSESSDVEMIMLYQQFVRDGDNEKKAKPPMNRKMGYLGTVNDTKEILEKIYKNNNTKSSPDQP